jgi:hypothetical protein
VPEGVFRARTVVQAIDAVGTNRRRKREEVYGGRKRGGRGGEGTKLDVLCWGERLKGWGGS